MESLVENLITQKESVWLEFKSIWYWDNNRAAQNNEWGEFLKDFVALFNTIHENYSEKYLIVGYDEAQEYNEFNLQNCKFFENLEEAKKKIVEKIERFFTGHPKKNSSSEFDISQFFHLNKSDEKNILIITITQAPYSLILNKDLCAKKTPYRVGTVFFRRLKNKNQPENVIASPNDLKNLEAETKKIKETVYSEKAINLENILTSFKNKNMPQAILENQKSTVPNHFKYQIFTLRCEYSQPHDFIYLHKDTPQKRTITYINKNEDLDKNVKKIILVNEKNQGNGTINKENIQKQFSTFYKHTQTYYIERFAYEKLYKEYLNSEVFHDGGFRIEHFTDPFTEESGDKTATTSILEWFFKTESPLLVIKGIGGVGKTTVLKHCLETIYNKNNKNILYISSNELIKDILKRPTLDSIFDFYEILAQKIGLAANRKFDQELFNLCIDHGDLVIVLDGLDEVIAKLGVNFNIKTLVDSIFCTFSLSLKKTKVFITCRDNFWDTNEIHQEFQSITIKPFSTEIATKYLNSVFNKQQHKVKKTLSIAQSISQAINKNETTILPYILDLVVQKKLNNDYLGSVTTKELKINSILNDYIVGKVCDREKTKGMYDSIDIQIKIFEQIALDESRPFTESTISKVCRKLRLNNHETLIQNLKAHPLCIVHKQDYLPEQFYFRYDLFEEYFQNIALANFLKGMDIKKLNDEHIELIKKSRRFNQYFFKDLRCRLEDLDFEKLEIFIFDCLSKSDEFDRNDILEFKSSLFSLYLLLIKKSTLKKRTEILLSFFSSQSKIQNLYLLNPHDIDKSKLTFDFKGLTFENCHFENFKHFTQCEFDQETFFQNTKILGYCHENHITTLLTKNNIDFLTCKVDEGLSYLLEDQLEQSQKTEQKLRNNLKQLLRIFWSGGKFKTRRLDEVQRKVKTFPELLDTLIEQGVIEIKKQASRDKREDKKLSLNKKRGDLSKMMEENETCPAFEKILEACAKK